MLSKEIFIFSFNKSANCIAIPGRVEKPNTMMQKIQILARNTALSKIYADLYRACSIYSITCIAIAGRVNQEGPWRVC